MLKIKVDTLAENTLYARTTIVKLLTENNISNHFVVDEEQLIILYKNTEFKNQKSWSLRNYIEEIIPNIKEKLI